MDQIYLLNSVLITFTLRVNAICPLSSTSSLACTCRPAADWGPRGSKVLVLTLPCVIACLHVWQYAHLLFQLHFCLKSVRIFKGMENLFWTTSRFAFSHPLFYKSSHGHATSITKDGTTRRYLERKQESRSLLCIIYCCSHFYSPVVHRESACSYSEEGRTSDRGIVRVEVVHNVAFFFFFFYIFLYSRIVKPISVVCPLCQSLKLHVIISY